MTLISGMCKRSMHNDNKPLMRQHVAKCFTFYNYVSVSMHVGYKVISKWV